KQYHPKYTPMDKIMEQAKKEGFDSWYKLFQKHGDYYGGSGNNTDPGSPTLQTFYIEKRGLDFLVLKRNPYYWKVDTAGNQLPYIDEIFVSDIQNPEVVNMKIASGEVDLAEIGTSMDNYSFYMENREKGGYRVLTWQSIIGADVAFQLNLTYAEDPVLRNIFRDTRFRKALSLALNRDEINSILYLGLGTPRQATVIPQSPYFEESFAKAYIEYNPKEANRLLDEMGLKKGPDGYRLRPDGKRLEILLEYEDNLETPKGKTTEMAVHYWDAIGVKVTPKVISSSLKSQRTSANLIQFGLWHADRAGFLFTTEPYYWVPIEVRSEALWCVEWGRWFASGGKAGEEPPAE
ncbi:MAG TPA: ABC transporter substrate-binding protein, partial [bacterium]|nr:ABC transporter substrate-binding protein [bacterium]